MLSVVKYRHRAPRATQKWTPPPEGQLKINTDGAFVKETLSCGWGFVVRDHQGEVVAVGARRSGMVLDAFTIETTA
jgi:hypothetical protein